MKLSVWLESKEYELVKILSMGGYAFYVWVLTGCPYRDVAEKCCSCCYEKAPAVQRNNSPESEGGNMKTRHKRIAFIFTAVVGLLSPSCW